MSSDQDELRQRARLLLLAAEQGDADAQAHLGQILLDGSGIARDQKLALTWFRIAAAQDNPMALNMVGRCLENGWGCEVDLTGAARHFHRAAALGLDWGIYNYAQLLTRGRGVAQDMQQACRLFAQAAEMGHAKSMNLLGRFYAEGVVVQADQDKARELYQRAAQGGDFRGQYNHAAVLAEDGRLDEAVDWLRKALTSATPGFIESARQVLATSALPRIREVAAEYQVAAEQLQGA